ncbi:MAG: hypothetical protein HY420_03655 [Candidatus Kerfeldbacteria bacterium]|nr:hypothetical protein [Candidatus Kerfeldbacteria bacterium]
MFLTTHAAAGIFLSQYVSNPTAVFGLSFASHFLLDFIPHGDENLYHDHEWRHEHRYRQAVLINLIDVTTLTILTLWAIQQQSTPSNLLVIAILGSILPDFLSHFFPFIHQRLSWLGLVRWIYAATKPTGFRYMVRFQNWIHNALHHELVRRDVPFGVGLVIQLTIVLVLLTIGVR